MRAETGSTGKNCENISAWLLFTVMKLGSTSQRKEERSKDCSNLEMEKTRRSQQEKPQQQERGRTNQQPSNSSVVNPYELYSLSSRKYARIDHTTVKNMSIRRKYPRYAATTCVTLNKLFNLCELALLSIKQYHLHAEGLDDIAHKKHSKWRMTENVQ